MTRTANIYVGWDATEVDAYEVCCHSIQKNSSIPVETHWLKQDELREKGVYTRPVERRDGQLWDPISEAPMSTEFAITRFLVAHLAGSGWAVFCDCDFMWRGDIAELLALADDRYAVMCVQHNHRPTETVKMEGQAQTKYSRKNWSSMMLINCDHPSNKKLTLEMINGIPGRDLHAFCWLEDDEIGAVPATWNWLEGITDPDVDPKVVHFTRGGPWHKGFEDVRFADEWRKELAELKGATATS